MGDISNVLGGPWSPPAPKQPEPIEHQVDEAMRSLGIVPPKTIHIDGKMHRFASDGRKGDNGWYVIFGDGLAAGRFGCWKQGVEASFVADIGRRLTPAEEMANARRMTEARAARDVEVAKGRAVAADTVEQIWAGCVAALPDHPYLARKGIQPNGARTTGDGRLVVPLYNHEGALRSLQYIDHEGGKLYHSGGQTGDCYWMLGTLDQPGDVYLAEGFATAATIHETTNRPCLVAFSASNLVNVAGHFTQHPLTIVADNDESGVGLKYAEQASAKYGVRVIMPPLRGDANDYKQNGHDLLALLAPPTHDWLIPADSFSDQPRPIKWLVKRWLQDEALIMVHGPSGGGKTFVVLDWCMHIASKQEQWNGMKVRPGPIVYLAGEGHNGLRGRIAAWKCHHGVDHLDMWLSKAGCDLNTPNGYRMAADNIKSLDQVPRLIVVDTLHRFLDGDENSAQDAKTMVDACGSLMREFGCSVLIVHHTGVSEESQHRARGSSAWKGALDIEISVVKAGDQIKLAQKKMKDGEEAEPFFMELQGVTLPGWFDEDGDPVGSAVVVAGAAPVAHKKDTKLDSFKKMFEAAWWASGCEDEGGMPYISRSALLRHLVTSMGMSEASAKQALKPSEPGRMIGALLVSEIIVPNAVGWRVQEAIFASSMMMAKNG